MRKLMLYCLSILGLLLCGSSAIIIDAQGQTYGQVQWGQQQGTPTPNIVIFDGVQNVPIGQLNTIAHSWLPAGPGSLTVSGNLQVQGASIFSGAPQFGGWIANGSSHILSTVTSYLGINTTGYTLPQWQALLPAATNLGDELDWAVVQSLIQNAAASGGSVWLGCGKFMMNKPLTVGAVSIEIFGSGGNNTSGLSNGIGCTTLNFTGGTDGIDHGPSLASGVRMHNLMLNSTTKTGSIYGINDQSANYTLLENVYFNGFNNCIKFSNPGGSTLRSVWCQNGQARGTAGIGTGIEYDGTASFVNHIYDSLMQGYNLCQYFHSTNPTPNPVGIEDLQVVNSACGGVNNGIKIDAVSSGYGPYNYSFTNMSMDVVGQFMDIEACNDIIVNGGNWLIDAATGSWTQGGSLFDIGHTTGCHHLSFRDLWIGNQTLATFTNLFFCEACSDVVWDHTHIETNNMTATNYFNIVSGADNIRETNTGWRSNFVFINPPSNWFAGTAANVTNRMESFVLQYPALASGGPSLSACGSSPSPTLSALANNEEGTITEGGGTPTSCTLTFGAPNRKIVPSCILFNTQGSAPLTMTALTAAAITYTHSAGAMTVHYKCTPY